MCRARLDFSLCGCLSLQPVLPLQPNLQGILGGLFILYGLIIYPTLGYFLGHVYPTSPTFGAPCPTTIFTFGLLLWTDRVFPRYVIGIPLLWSLIGFMAALSFTISEDYGLLITGLPGTLVILLRRDPQVAANPSASNRNWAVSTLHKKAPAKAARETTKSRSR